MNNSSGGVNSFDDKNRDTFGEDFVMDHQIQQQARQQRYHYGERENFRRGKLTVVKLLLLYIWESIIFIG